MNYTIRIKVVDELLKESDIDVEEIRRQEQERNRKELFPAPVMTITPIDNFGIFDIKFD